MTVASLSPEYFGKPETWALVLHAGKLIVDDRQPYRRQTLQNRARLRTPDGWQWISIPLLGGQRGNQIQYAEIDRSVPWRKKHYRSLAYNYRTSSYFEFYEQRFVEFFDTDWKYLGDVAAASMGIVSDMLDLAPPVRKSNIAENPQQDEPRLPDDDVAGGAGTVRFEPAEYRQNFEGFEPGMSILDMLFNLGPETTAFLRNHSHAG